MKTQNLNKIILTFAFGIILAGCGYVNSKIDKHPPTQRHQQCINLKNQMILSQGATGINTKASKNPAQDARNMRLYEENKCADFEKTSDN